MIVEKAPMVGPSCAIPKARLAGKSRRTCDTTVTIGAMEMVTEILADWFVS
jgi:hypothetical protein